MIKQLLTAVLILSCNDLSGQSFRKTIQSDIDGVIFKMEFIDSLYSYRDTLNINYEVLNNTNTDVYIFDDDYKNLTFNSKEETFRFGSSWTYNSEYDLGTVTKINKASKYEKIISGMIIDDKNVEASTIDLDDLYLYNNVKERRTFTFHSSYFASTDQIKFEFRNLGDKKHHLGFKTDKDGYYFQQHLKRFSIGTLEIRIKK